MDETQTSFIEFEDKAIVREFCDLLECSKQLFNGLSELPQYGQRKWQPYFTRTFETYTKLWKFQQDNRMVLDRTYNLKRWQIGEIASKIGQLYYHYYLRTSDTNYLNEAYQFYAAIRSRNYYQNVNKEGSPELILKKHRYYARFVVVCLLLNYKKDVHDLVRDFSKQVEENKNVLIEKEENEWYQVVAEVKEFMDSDPVQVIHADTYQTCNIPMRLTPTSLPPVEKGIQTHVTLGDAVIVGNSPSQVKFSELTIDMFRIIQALERSTSASSDSGQRLQKANPSQERADRIIKRDNPHKYLLYRPTFFQLFTFLATAVKELPPGNALLLYLSAQGSKTKNNKTEIQLEGGYELGGIKTNDRNEDNNNSTNKSLMKNMHCLHQADLYPFMRKPMLLIVDSDNAKAFDNLPNLFNQPIICLMAPEDYPHTNKEYFSRGRLLTTFLYSPLMAFMHVCGIDQTSDRLYETCSQVIDKALQEIQSSYLRSRTIDHSFLQFFGDDFLRLILLRFAFCFCALRLHRSYKDSRYYPKSYPILPDEDFVGNPVINKAIVDMADVLGVRGLFMESNPA